MAVRLHAVPQPKVVDAIVESPERVLMRALQTIVDAMSTTPMPTHRERSNLRAAAHQAIDTYMVNKFAGRLEEGVRPGDHKPPAPADSGDED